MTRKEIDMLKHMLDKLFKSIAEGGEPKTELELMKELWKTGDYVCYVDFRDNRGYIHLPRPRFENDKNIFKLIHNKDALTAKAVANDSSVEVEYQTSNGWYIEDDFFGRYRTEVAQNIHYRLKEPKPNFKDCNLENTYVKADKDTFEALEKRGKKPSIRCSNNHKSNRYGRHCATWFYVGGSGFVLTNKDPSEDCNIIHYNKEHDYFTDVEPKGEDMHYINHDDFFKDLESKQQETISISDGDKAEHFAKFGFEVPEFGAEIVGETTSIGTTNEGVYLMGYYEERFTALTHTQKIPTFWNAKTGSCYKGAGVSNSKYNLTPLKQPTVEEPKFKVGDVVVWSNHAGESIIVRLTDNREHSLFIDGSRHCVPYIGQPFEEMRES